MAHFYRGFVDPGDLCFDLGAHLGNHTRALLDVGAKVVAVEPQPHFMGALRRWYDDHPQVHLVEMAVAAESGQGTLRVSRMTPTVSTLTSGWMNTVRRAPGFDTVEWQDRHRVQVTTLDELIAEFGAPAFCKIDVEGGELDALLGLTTPLAALSFEYIPLMIDLALDCVERLEALGSYEYQWSEAEPLRLRGDCWLGADGIQEVLSGLRDSPNSGDVLARLNNSD